MRTHRSSTARPAPRPPAARRAAALSLALGTGLLASGCAALTADDGRESAERVAAALTAGSVEDLGFGAVAGPFAQQQYEEATAGLGEATASVEVTTVEDTGQEDRREATLAWSWDLPGTDRDWAYDAVLPLVRSAGGEWVPEWSPGVVRPGLEEGEALRARTVAADRGDILGADGETLVTERPIRRVGIDRSQLDGAEPAAAARRLAAAVDIDADAYAEAVEQAGPEAFVEAVPLRLEDFRELDAQQMDAVPGLLVVEDELPLAPSRGFAADLLGAVAPATAEDLEASGGDLATGALVGRGGLQEQFDDRLGGTPGVVVEEVVPGADGGPASAGEPLFEVPAQAGEPVTVSLDRGLQATAEELLTGIESPSAIVAIRPSTGEVVASANGPGSEGYSTALLGQYAPGSTFKVVTALSMLREGDTPGTEVQCPPSTTAAGVQVDNVESYPPEFTGTITLTEAIAHSCNTAFVDQHERVSQAELAAAAGSLGIGAETDLGLPVFTGAVPAEEEPAQHAAAMFGQGRTLVSPLAMANLTASVAAGELVTPRLVTTEGLLDDAATTGPGPAEPLTGPEAEQLRTMMRAVVSSGHLEVLQELEPDTAIGKTGTAEFGDEDPPRTHSWVIAEHEDLAVAVFVEDGGLGSITGGPLMRDFLAAASAARTG
ncbi:penicillin-binding transpeptidase domain-containing protein [Kocuria sp. CNJ-770]|uniref:penicillin-binding transpeptidase domain-containing protein n=1 Tax=Kocuria sp. CNJ-770 TaxID=1904964 RepID=UPI000AA13E3D|nr:penicillin-binding transpeptidase domain-containing protein [Kocuria sp. CNJ-770]